MRDSEFKFCPFIYEATQSISLYTSKHEVTQTRVGLKMLSISQPV
jgi:hypothetical protein